MRNPTQVVEALEALLDRLAEASEEGAVLVEGRRDAAALRSLEVAGEVAVLNRGVPLLKRCEQIAQGHTRVVILTDWDEKGDELAAHLAPLLRRHGAAVDLRAREELRALTRGAVKAVEELPSFLRRARAAALSKGPARAQPVNWRERKAVRQRLIEARRMRGEARGPRP